jgi:hypothetical protein
MDCGTADRILSSDPFVIALQTRIVSGGLTRKQAAAIAGVSPIMLSRWMGANGKEPIRPHLHQIGIASRLLAMDDTFLEDEMLWVARKYRSRRGIECRTAHPSSPVRPWEKWLVATYHLQLRQPPDRKADTRGSGHRRYVREGRQCAPAGTVRTDRAEDASEPAAAPGRGQTSDVNEAKSPLQRDRSGWAHKSQTKTGKGLPSGEFRDPDGHLWEVIWNPGMPPRA